MTVKVDYLNYTPNTWHKRIAELALAGKTGTSGVTCRSCLRILPWRDDGAPRINGCECGPTVTRAEVIEAHGLTGHAVLGGVPQPIQTWAE